MGGEVFCLSTTSQDDDLTTHESHFSATTIFTASLLSSVPFPPSLSERV